ncbi:hypothetical protein OAS86_02180 [Gammaproteobacteria bacterium]|nr:hypothetical protein [Gammaproteobacteria bacterium]
MHDLLAQYLVTHYAKRSTAAVFSLDEPILDSLSYRPDGYLKLLDGQSFIIEIDSTDKSNKRIYRRFADMRHVIAELGCFALYIFPNASLKARYQARFDADPWPIYRTVGSSARLTPAGEVYVGESDRQRFHLATLNEIDHLPHDHNRIA